MPEIGAPFKYRGLEGVVVERVLTVFDYIDVKKLKGYPVYNIVIELKSTLEV